MEDADGKEVEEKADFYRKEIIEMIQNLERDDKLRYLYILVEDVVKAE